MNERRDLPVVGNSGGTNRLSPRASDDVARPEGGTAPGASLRDPGYHDLCAFFGTYPDGQAWQPALGDWVYLPRTREVRLVLDVEEAGPPSEGGGPAARARLQVMSARLDDAVWLPAGDCVWLPTLDQLRRMVHDVYGSAGFFTSVFTNTTYWYQGELAGMEVENMSPLSEGRSPEEAAVKALLMRFQR